MQAHKLLNLDKNDVLAERNFELISVFFIVIISCQELYSFYKFSSQY